MSSARALTQTTRSGVKFTNLEATAPHTDESDVHVTLQVNLFLACFVFGFNLGQFVSTFIWSSVLIDIRAYFRLVSIN